MKDACLVAITEEEFQAEAVRIEEERKRKEAQLERERLIQKQKEDQAQQEREKEIQKQKDDQARKQDSPSGEYRKPMAVDEYFPGKRRTRDQHAFFKQ